MDSFRDKLSFFGASGGKCDIKAPTTKDTPDVNSDLYADTSIFFGKQTLYRNKPTACEER
jgi:hypothetical protein